MWSHQLCRPFFKDDAVGLRPVMCGEALFKYAAACAIYAATRSIQAAVGYFQYGAGRSGGAALQLAEVQAEAHAYPADALASLDVKNAFGSIAWADALRIATAAAPKLALTPLRNLGPREPGDLDTGIDARCLDLCLRGR